ncbi:hypothetical protein METSCH_B04840 [Metschnikowia aff. pulcherrima]|uniref:Uncharacterized protein n=1 Tax=Metschnikowia aff. pulcherrima TaxID=2163413 RepID=A0A4V1ADY0_9ASCO|nr:hypothetical protein METSCH_B04840 [Metschnikowia aff. pulcherrima]
MICCKIAIWPRQIRTCQPSERNAGYEVISAWGHAVCRLNCVNIRDVGNLFINLSMKFRFSQTLKHHDDNPSLQSQESFTQFIHAGPVLCLGWVVVSYNIWVAECYEQPRPRELLACVNLNWVNYRSRFGKKMQTPGKPIDKFRCGTSIAICAYRIGGVSRDLPFRRQIVSALTILTSCKHIPRETHT